MITIQREPTPNPNEPFDTAAQTYARGRVTGYLDRDPGLPPEVAANLVRMAAILDHKDEAFQVEAADEAKREVHRRRGAS